MDEKTAVKLLGETFNSSFDSDRFSKFTKELLNEFVIAPKELGIWTEYRDYISSAHSLGIYEDQKKELLEVFVVKLQRTGSIQRARTMQRNFIAKYLGKFNKNAALVAFYGEDPEDWRFSFVKLEYRLKRDEKGKVNPEEELTPAKRYSYLVGINEPNHTCKKQFLELLKNEEVNPSLQEIEQAFSVDKVTKEFFNEYKELYLRLTESIEKIIEKNPQVRKEFEEKDISIIDFSKKLLGQIVFIYFLQKKGWLGVGKDPDTGEFKPWGQGPKNFLRRLFDKNIVSYTNFFNDILEPLFYDALSTERDKDYYTPFKCRIPFLNGGLFEAINQYDWTCIEIPLENKIFGDILDTFDRYNFTVKEDEPLEKEVAIDPEMLGKVFENLLEIKDRKSKGSFYTPREIVHYMCQQSIISYLQTNTGIPGEYLAKFIELKDTSSGEDEKHMQTIERLENTMTSGGDVDSSLRKIVEESEKLTIPRSVFLEREKVDHLLKEIKIVDPAVGSGAFPIGMMTEIVRARSVLTRFYRNNDEKIKRTEYDLKRQTIENSLYGADLDSSAVDITKLRFWLSLIVDEQDIEKIQPLPNLDYKIMCGNSLLEEFEGIKLFDEKLLEAVKDVAPELTQIETEKEKLGQELNQIYTGKKKDEGRIKEINRRLDALKKKRLELLSSPKGETIQASLNSEAQRKIKESQKKLRELIALQKQFFNEQNKKQKNRLREEIDKLEWQLIEETLKEQGNPEAVKKLEQYKKNKSKPFLLWKLYFSDVFQEKGGFDVVIANPPYVQLQTDQGKLAEMYSKASYQTFTRTGDIYCLFYERANQILRPEGVACFITSNKWMRAAYGEKLRTYFANHTQPLKLIDLGPDVFETATVDTNILLFKKGTPVDSFSGCTLQKKIEIPLSDYIRLHSIKIPVPGDGKLWEIRSPIQQRIAQKIEKHGTPLKEWNLKINFGIKTGYNEAFIIDGSKKNELIASDPKSAEIIKPLIRGRDTARYTAEFADNWLINAHNGFIDGHGHRVDRIKIEGYPPIKSHLDRYWTELKTRADQGDTPYNLRSLAYYIEFSKEKVVWKRIGSVMRFCYDDSGAFCLDSTCIATGEKIKYLVGVLNSKLCLYELFRISPKTGTGDQIISVQALEPLRIPKPNTKQEKEITDLVDQILPLTKDSDYSGNPDKQAKVRKLEKEIDQLVYNLYNLTSEEIAVIKNFYENK